MKAKKRTTKGQLRRDALKLLNDAGGRRLESRYGDAARRLQITRRQAQVLFAGQAPSEGEVAALEAAPTAEVIRMRERLVGHWDRLAERRLARERYEQEEYGRERSWYVAAGFSEAVIAEIMDDE